MTTAYSTLLGLALPVQGELSGTWGDMVDNGITRYVDIAVAGTVTLTNDGAVTLSLTNGDSSATNIVSSLTGAGTVSAQFAIIKVTGTLTTAKVLTAPSSSRTYVVVNAATGSTVTVKAASQTGVSIAVGETAFVYFNGTDYVKVTGSTINGDVVGPASATDNAITRFDLTTGKLIQNSLVTVADDGAIVAPVVSSIIPFYFSSTLPSAASYHGAVSHLHSTGKLYYAHSSAWQIITSGLGTADTAGTVTPVGSSGQLLTNNGQGGLTSNTTGTGVVTALGINLGSAGAFAASNTATTFTATQTFAGSSSALAIILSDTAEVATISPTAATGTINYDVTTQSVLYYTTSASANWTVNFRASSGTSLNTAMTTGQSVTAAFLVTQGATAYYNSVVQVDGSTVTPKYQGGTAPAAGNASSVDVYMYTIIKTGNAAFTVFASQTKFA